jgi:hypothetical protein
MVNSPFTNVYFLENIGMSPNLFARCSSDLSLPFFKEFRDGKFTVYKCIFFREYRNESQFVC